MNTYRCNYLVTCNRPATLAIQSRAVVAAVAARVVPTSGAARARRRAGKTVAFRNPLSPYTDTVGIVAAAVVVRSYRTVAVVDVAVVGAVAALVAVVGVGIRAVCAAWNRSWRAQAGTHCAVS